MKSFDEKLTAYHKSFQQGHDQLRRQLMDSLPDMGYGNQNVPARASKSVLPFNLPRAGMLRAFRKVAAVAAVFVILLGAVYVFSPSGVSSQAAWAKAVDNFEQVHSVHFKYLTSSGKKSFVEMWWRRPHDFRMEFSNNLILTGNKTQRCTYNKMLNSVSISKANGPGLEMAILGSLGHLFTSQFYDSPISPDVSKSKVLRSEEIIYKGQKCHKVMSENDDELFEYIIDQNGSMVYDIKRFRKSAPDKVISHVEVFEVDRQYSDSLFTIDNSIIK